MYARSDDDANDQAGARMRSMTPERAASNRAAGIFIGLTFGVSWSMAALFWLLGGKYGEGDGSFALALAYMLVPAVMAVITQRFILGQPLTRPLGISLRPSRWFLIAWLTPFLFLLATMSVSMLIPGVRYDPFMHDAFARFEGVLTLEQMNEVRRLMDEAPMHPFWVGLFQALVAGITLNALTALGQELGWRGFLQRHLIDRGFWRSSIFIGTVWGLWHAPLILQGHNYPENPVIGVAMMTLYCVLLAPAFALVTLRAGSVLPAAILHGTINATAGLSVLMISGGADLLVGYTGAAGFVFLIGVNAAIWAAPNRLKEIRPPNPSQTTSTASSTTVQPTLQ
jgi:uncharacterized protein